MVELDFFEQFKRSIGNLDPVKFCETYLQIDGAPFTLSSGYKPFADIYRYVGLKALEPNSKPVILVKGRQVGATTMLAALSIALCASSVYGQSASKPPIRIMHCWPQQEQRDKYTKTKLNVMMSSGIALDGSKIKGGQKSYIEEMLDASSPANNNLSFKQFKGGNQIFIEYAGYDGDRLRGMTFDFLAWDEIQSFINAGQIFNTVEQSLKKSKYGNGGCRVYMGTPKEKSSDYWRMWNRSSQQYYHLHCEKCNDYFPLYTPDDVESWEKTWLYAFVVKCAHCGHEQDKRVASETGKWFCYGDPDAEYIGYHINQLHMPHLTKEQIIAEKPGNHPTNSERTYYNEILGLFYSGDSSPITYEEFDSQCAEITRSFLSRINFGQDQKAYLGCDWGKRDDTGSNDAHGVQHSGNSHASYSCAVVLVPEGSTLFCAFAKRFSKNTAEYRKSLIDQIMRTYNISQACGDIGYAPQLMEELNSKYDSKFLATNALGGKLNNHERYISDISPQIIMFDRDYYLRELFDLMKQGRVKFPVKNYDQIAWLVNHICLGLEIKTTKTKFGEENNRFVKSSIPCDGLMALLNAYLAYKFDVTNQFSTSGIQMTNGSKQVKKPSVIAAFAPKRKF